MAYLTALIFYSTGPLAAVRTTRTSPGSATPSVSLRAQESIPQTISTSYGADEKIFPREYATYCSRSSVRVASVIVLFSSGNNSVGRGDCVTNDGSVRFIPFFSATCTCGVFLRLRPGVAHECRVQVSHHAATHLQVPVLLSSAERRTTCRKSQRADSGAASRTTFN